MKQFHIKNQGTLLSVLVLTASFSLMSFTTHRDNFRLEKRHYRKGFYFDCWVHPKTYPRNSSVTLASAPEVPTQPAPKQSKDSISSTPESFDREQSAPVSAPSNIPVNVPVDVPVNVNRNVDPQINIINNNTPVLNNVSPAPVQARQNTNPNPPVPQNTTTTNKVQKASTSNSQSGNVKKVPVSNPVPDSKLKSNSVTPAPVLINTNVDVNVNVNQVNYIPVPNN